MIHRASALFIANNDPAYLAGTPRHNRNRARETVEKMQLGIFLPQEVVAMEDALCPDYQLAIGSYDRGMYFSFPDEMYGCIENLQNPIMAKILSQYEKAHILAIELNRTRNYFAYVLYRKGQLKRRLAGDMVRGVFIDEGEMQPEEKSHFEKSILRDGKRFFPSTKALRMPWEKQTLPAEEVKDDEEMFVYGEMLVSAMMASFIGPPEKQNLQKLKVELFD